jgi:tripartite-type tricarboxylate transporter receptor subunit TctC
MESRRPLVGILIGLGLTLAGPPVLAQTWPDRPVRIVVPFAAGGGSDVLARLAAQALQPALGKPVVVENRTGAGGNIGTEHVVRAAPDGYSLVLVNNTVSINQAMGNQPFDAVRDLSPVILVAATPPMIGSWPGLAAGSLVELIQLARTRPDELSYASCGTGTAHHLAAELLQSMARVRLRHIPYKGCAQAIPDVISGQVAVVFSTVANLAPHVRGGRIRGLATTGASRALAAPELPTVAEVGYPGYHVEAWFGLMGPAGLPREITLRLNGVLNAALEQPEMRAQLRAQFYEPIGGTPERFGAAIRQELATYVPIVREAGIKAE